MRFVGVVCAWGFLTKLASGYDLWSKNDCDDGYVVSGAGDDAYNGCYRNTSSQHGHVYQKDTGQQLYSYQGVWSLGFEGG